MYISTMIKELQELQEKHGDMFIELYDIDTDKTFIIDHLEVGHDYMCRDELNLGFFSGNDYE